ncbi:hypothetical protein SprV_0401439700 [Sparganum proliferum]
MSSAEHKHCPEHEKGHDHSHGHEHGSEECKKVCKDEKACHVDCHKPGSGHTNPPGCHEKHAEGDAKQAAKECHGCCK